VPIQIKRQAIIRLKLCVPIVVVGATVVVTSDIMTFNECEICCCCMAKQYVTFSDKISHRPTQN